MAEIAEQTPGGQSFTPIDEVKRQRLLELVRGRAMARPTDLAEDEVMVWPSLVVVEAVSATVFLLILVALSVLVNAPLTARANPNQTPEPLESALVLSQPPRAAMLHMDPGLAGVIIPTVALVGIAAIPYIDRSPLGVGILGTSAKGRRIIGFTAVFTIVVQAVLIYFDELSGRTIFGLRPFLQNNLGLPEIINNQVVPSLIILALIGVLVALVQGIFHPTRRELIIALFTGFVVTYIVLTISGTSFRGPSQDLYWPWNLPLEHH